MSLREKIEASGAWEPPTELLDVAEWGVAVKLKALSLGGRNKLIADLRKKDNDAGLLEAYAPLIASQVLDPETDEPVFTEDDATDLPVGIAEQLGRAVLKLSGLGS